MVVYTAVEVAFNTFEATPETWVNEAEVEIVLAAALHKIAVYSKLLTVALLANKNAIAVVWVVAPVFSMYCPSNS